MPVRAVFFDVGDTLVQHWKPQEEVRVLVRDALRRELGDREWYEQFVESDIVPKTIDEEHRQETNRWYADWFRNSQIGIDDIEIDHFRVATTLPLDLVGALVPGTPEALRWCKDRGLIVGLITNTLSRGDDEVRTDWQRFGLAETVDHVVSSHSVGYTSICDTSASLTLPPANPLGPRMISITPRPRSKSVALAPGKARP